MSDVLPKFKMYMFISFISIFLNIGYVLYTFILTDSFNILSLLAGFGSSFIPFISTISLVFAFGSIPVEVIAFVGVFTTIISIIQAYLIVIMVLNLLPLEDV